VNGAYLDSAMTKNGIWLSPDLDGDVVITCAEASCNVK
jgi:hypothetical protein